MVNKVVSSLREAITLSGLRDGMTVSFHHHLRSGDYVLNLVMAEIAAMGLKNITINASSLHDGHAPLTEHIRSGVVTGIETSYIGAKIGQTISAGALQTLHSQANSIFRGAITDVLHDAMEPEYR